MGLQYDTEFPCVVRHSLFEKPFQNGVLDISALESVIHHLFLCVRGQIIVAVYDSLQ